MCPTQANRLEARLEFVLTLYLLNSLNSQGRGKFRIYLGDLISTKEILINPFKHSDLI